MKTRIRPSVSTVLIYLLILCCTSCDVFEFDTIQPEKQVELTTTTLYTVTGKALILDIKSLIRESYVNASVAVNKVPHRGSFTRVEPLLYKYIPDAYFTEGEDQFELTIMSKGKLIKTELITIQSRATVQDFPCGYYGIEDFALVKPGEAVAVNILDNDRLCNVNPSDLQITIHIPPKSGEAEVLDNAVINYVPASGFAGRDEVIYQVSLPDNTVLGYGLLALSDRTREDDPVISPGMISLEGWLMEVTDLPFSESPFTTALSFTDENTGYAGMVDGIYKTIDGGAHWKKIFQDSDYRHGGFTMSFSDPLKGFVSYFIDSPHLPIGYNVIQTKDGGITWNKVVIEDLITMNAPYFNSSLTGFISGTTCLGYWDNDYEGKILKTTDGGSTWKEVLNQHNHAMATPVFFDELIGYAEVAELDEQEGEGFVSDKIYITNDAGESWQMLVRESENYINSLTHHPDKTLYFVCEPAYNVSVRISSIRKVLYPFNESSSIHVNYFPFAITSLKFSPSGNLGIAVGIEGKKHDVTSHKLGMSITFDKGATWLQAFPYMTFNGFTQAHVVAVLSDRLAYFRVDNKLVKFWRP